MIFFLLINTPDNNRLYTASLHETTLMAGEQKLKRSMSISQTNLNCFGSFDGIHKLILGKFRFGMALKRSKSICDNEWIVSNEDDIYLPNPVFSHDNLSTGMDFKAKHLRRTLSHGDLSLIGYSSLNAINRNEKKRWISFSDKK